MDSAPLANAMHIQLHLPHFFITDLLGATFSAYMITFLSVIIPMGLFNLLGSLQNLESAEAAGDIYPVRSSLAVNGLGTIAAACFGSVFPATIYIGHPGWKKMGAGTGYSVANGIAITLLCLSGLVGFVSALIPVEAGAPILLWIGITIASQAFQATPRDHAPAEVIGGLPFEERLIERASDWDVGPGQALRTCSAEDLVVLKTFAGRDLDSVGSEGAPLAGAGAR